MERGFAGNTPKPPRLADDSYLDYMTSVRNLAIKSWFPAIAEDVVGTAVAADMSPMMTADDYAKIAPALDAKTSVQAWKRVMRSQQQLTWGHLLDSYNLEREYWLGKLDDAAQKNPGRLHVDPNFKTPESACQDIHLQPAGYCNDDLAGYLFHHGTRVFYQGDNEQDGIQRSYVSSIEPPADKPVENILDIGCSIGQCTTELKKRFPDAQVRGIDVALPLIRYAHMRATELNIDVHFEQGLAEDLPHPDNAFDIVFAYILFHEVPEHTFEPIIREAHRVLRPGGKFIVIDAPNGSEIPVPNRLWLAFDARYNCEPYSPAFVATDIAALIGDCGFENVEHGPTPSFLSQTTASKPL